MKWIAVWLLGFAVTAYAGLNPQCRYLHETMGATGAGAGQARFEAAHNLKENGTGALLPEGGRRFDIPLDDIKGLSQAFKEDYTTALGAPGSSLSAHGNVGHMQDHLDLLKTQGKNLKTALDLDLPSLELTVSAHDIGKGFLDQAIAAYVKEKGDIAVKDGVKGFIPFVHNYVLSHEEHSIARVPEVVSKYLESKGIDPKSSKGRDLVENYSAQIIEAIRQHNGVDVSGDLKAKYPSLTDAEIEGVKNAWWASNYDIYGNVMGLDKTKYGGEVIPLAEALNFLDRATLTSRSAPVKLLLQKLGSNDWGIDLVHSATDVAASGNVPLIKAQADKLKKAMPSNDSARVAALNEVIGAADKMNQDMIELGQMLGRMNDPIILKAAGVPEEAGYVAYQRKNGEWIRINGKDKTNGIIEKKNPHGEWVAEEGQTAGVSPALVLMLQLTKDGRW